MPRPVSVIPVIHLANTRQAVAQAEICRSVGAEGVFVVNHVGSWVDLVEAAGAIREHVGVAVGVNALDLDAVGVFERLVPVTEVEYVWTDNARIDEHGETQPYAERVDDARAGWGGTYFGGVAFKYQREVSDLEVAAAKASAHMDVVCTSGPATGSAIDAGKVARLASTATVPIAVASGVGAHNLPALAAAGAQYFLVASSIAASWDEVDPTRLRALLDVVDGVNALRSR